jgi:hypothetical protein
MKFRPTLDSGDGALSLEPRLPPGAFVVGKPSDPTLPRPSLPPSDPIPKPEPDPGPLPDPDGPIVYPPPPLGGPVGPA